MLFLRLYWAWFIKFVGTERAPETASYVQCDQLTTKNPPGLEQENIGSVQPGGFHAAEEADKPKED